MPEHHALGLWVSMTWHLTSKYFMVHWFCLISWKLFIVWTLYIYFVIMSRCNAAFVLKQCRSQWSFFHGQVILPYILNSIWWMTWHTFGKWVSVINYDLWLQNNTLQWFPFFYILLWKTIKFYWQSTIKASYVVLRQLLFCFVFTKNFHDQC